MDGCGQFDMGENWYFKFGKLIRETCDNFVAS